MDSRQVDEAAVRLAGVAHRTPVMTSTQLNELTGNQIFLKCENFQRTGAFKFRGAYNAISIAVGSGCKGPIVTYSSGNHAQAAALAGKLLGVKVVVVMPEDAPAVKKEATAGYGARIVTYDRHTDSRETVTQQLIETEGGTLVPPFDSEDVVAGAGTAGKELFEETGPLDYLFVPCGGGGLLSGCALYAKAALPGCVVVGVEPALADDAVRSYHSGALLSMNDHLPKETIADGLRTPSLGEVNFGVIRKCVDDMVTTTEDEIVSTMRFLWTRMKIVAEPSGAVGLAPLFHRKYAAEGKRIGVLVSGGNADMDAVLQLFNKRGDGI